MKQPEWRRHELQYIEALLCGRSLREIAEERKVRVGCVYAQRRRLIQKLRRLIGESICA